MNQHDDGEDAMLALDRRVRDALPEWRLILVGVELVKELTRLRLAVERLAGEPNAAERERSKPPRKRGA